MIPSVQFDPATLSIWTTTGSLPEDIAKIAAAAMASASIGGDPLSAIAHLPEVDPVRRRVLWLASCVWHEKRHFFDICMTNYGARRFRDLFNLAANFLPLVADERQRREPVWLPVEVYGCHVRRRILGIPEPPPNIVEIARRARAMKRFAGTLDAPATSAGKALEVGGEAQLEGLAQVSQMHAIEHRCGLAEAFAVTAEHVHRLPQEGPYRTIEAVAGALGCAREMGDRGTAVDSGLASALFITALSGRFFGVGSEASADLVSPWLRLARLIDALGPSPGRFGMPDEEAWELVDGAARRLWGRTALEEIEADIEAMDAARARISQPWVTAEGLIDAYGDFVALRRKLFVAVRAAGPASLLPRAFPLLWLDRLLPWHVVATPGGEAGIDDTSIVFGRSLNLPPSLKNIMASLIVWGKLEEAPPDRSAADFALQDRTAWLQMLRLHAPRARIMLNGRRYRRMVPPELEQVIEWIKEMGIAVRFDPFFEWPEDRDRVTRGAEALALATWAGRTTFRCDVTGEEIPAADAAVLTPWEFRRSPLLPLFRDVVGTELVADLQLETDWTDWVIRRNLLPN